MTETFGAELARHRNARGLSLRALAGRTHFSAPYLSQVENRRRAPTREIAEQCDAALGLDGKLVARFEADHAKARELRLPGVESPVSPDELGPESRQLWEADLNRSEFLRNGVAASSLLVPAARWLLAHDSDVRQNKGANRLVGQADVERVRTMVGRFETLDHLRGGGYARTAAVQYLVGDVAPLLDGTYNSRTGRELFAAAAECTYKTGAMGYDIGAHGLARRYFLHALAMADTSGDRALGGKVLALMSHQATFLGEYSEAVTLARAATMGAGQHATPRVRAMYAAMEARALAGLGDAAGCRRRLADAEREFEHADGSSPTWINYFDAAELNDEIAHCAAALGDAQVAMRHALLAIDLSGSQYPRSRAFCRLAVATSYVTTSKQSGRDLDAACDLVGHVLPALTTIKSKRIRAYLRRFDKALKPFQNSAAARTYLERREATGLDKS